MKRLAVAGLAAAMLAGSGASASDAVTAEDFKALVARLEKLEKENAAQARRIAELEGRAARPAAAAAHARPVDEGTSVDASGRLYTTASGSRFRLADAAAGIFEPLSESGLRLTPYGYLVFEAVHNTHNVDTDAYTDFVRRSGNHTMTFSTQCSILGLKFETPEDVQGWRFSGKAEFDLVGATANDYDFHWRHLYVEAARDAYDGARRAGMWSILVGQTWHLWKMVSPSEIDGAWMENAGHPYRRSPQVRLTRAWEDGAGRLEARIGLVKGGPGMGGDRDADGIQDNSASAWALVEGALVYERDACWNTGDGTRRWLLGLGGMYGRDRTHRLTETGFDGREDDYTSAMVMLAGRVPFGDFTLTGQIFAGENLGGVQAGCAQRVGYPGDGRKGREVSTVGGFVDLSYRLDDRWSFAAGYGFDDPDDSDARLAGGIFMNDRAYLAAFFDVAANFRLGAEYARLRTKYADVGTKDDDRFQLSAWYNF